MTEKADTWLTMEVECPQCGQIQEVEWVDECESEYNEEICFKCNHRFKYAHPENQYGL